MRIEECDFEELKKLAKKIIKIEKNKSAKYFKIKDKGLNIGGFKLLEYKSSIRLMHTFILQEYRKKGYIPKMILEIMGKYQKTIHGRSPKKMKSYWLQYGFNFKQISKNIEDFEFSKEKIIQKCKKFQSEDYEFK